MIRSGAATLLGPDGVALAAAYGGVPIFPTYSMSEQVCSCRCILSDFYVSTFKHAILISSYACHSDANNTAAGRKNGYFYR